MISLVVSCAAGISFSMTMAFCPCLMHFQSTLVDSKIPINTLKASDNQLSKSIIADNCNCQLFVITYFFIMSYTSALAREDTEYL